MTTCHAIILTLVAVLTSGVAHAEDISPLPASEAAPEPACLVDDHLSVWLSLEAADRMVALLEKERRELTEELAQASATLELMDEGRVVSQGVTLTRSGVLRTSETGSREVLKETHDQFEKRLDEVNKTVKRRRMQRASLEERLNLYLGQAPTAQE